MIFAPSHMADGRSWDLGFGGSGTFSTPWGDLKWGGSGGSATLDLGGGNTITVDVEDKPGGGKEAIIPDEIPESDDENDKEDIFDSLKNAAPVIGLVVGMMLLMKGR